MIDTMGKHAVGMFAHASAEGTTTWNWGSVGRSEPPSGFQGQSPGNVFANKCYGDAIWGLLRGTFETARAKFLRSQY